MLMEFLATIIAGVGAAGLILGLRKLTRGRLPKWLAPAAAGLAMLAVTLQMDYSWFNRSLDALGPDAVLATQIEKKQIWRPWTYLAPITTRFVALDGKEATWSGDVVVTKMYLLSRHQDGAIVPVAFDCDTPQRADLIGLAKAPIPDMLAQVKWIELSDNDPILRAACDQLR
nr:hypothetical protein [uncultured Celeribacter sp.]